MRSCEDFELLINLFLDDMLPSEECRPLEEHLKECQACRSRYEQLRAMKEALADMEEPVPEGLHGQILDYVEKNCPESVPTVSAAPVPFYRKRWYRALAGAAACAVVVIVAARFVPGLDLAVTKEAAAEAPQVMAPTFSAAGSAPMATAPAAMDRAESYAPSQSVVTSNSADRNETGAMDAAPPVANALTGQMAEDLPPVRQEYANEDNTYRVPSIRKWLKVTGPRERLPEWVDLHFVYQAELDGASRDYVEIAAWAEEYWIDQLTACGFTVEVLDEHDVSEDGEHILLVFYWK
ncbi:MAG: zf-HC2 domain-containing protein [Clostridia bacterium]|nr:zf-HC2 domain-containing protein [Clostridia bacterium]